MIFLFVLSFQSPSNGVNPFLEEASTRGLNYSTFRNPASNPFGGGIGAIDLDGDGDSDVVLVGSASGVIGLFENNGLGQFSSIQNHGIPADTKYSGVAAGDYDGDGDWDLYLSSWGSQDRLLRNEGSFQFVDVTSAAGIFNTGLAAGVNFSDANADGFLDIFVGNRTTGNHLYINQGDGTFLEQALSYGFSQSHQATFQGLFFDFDRDEDLDFYIANDRGMLDCPNFHNSLFENVGGVYVDITTSSGTESCTDSMNITAEDFTGNGYADLYITSQELGNRLLCNQGDGTFLGLEDAAGVGSYATAWGAYFFDCDNNSQLDLYVCNMAAPNRLYVQDGAWPTQDLGPGLAVADGGMSFCVAGADFDNDGDIDLVLSNGDGPIKLFMNPAQLNGNNFIRFEVIGTGSNQHGIGARVSYNNGLVQSREVFAGSNYKSQNEPTAHFGLGSSSNPGTTTCRWLDGSTRTLTNYPINHDWELVHPSLLTDPNRDGNSDTLDLYFIFDRLGLPFVPGMEWADLDGNGSITSQDIETLLTSLPDPGDCDMNLVSDYRDIFIDGAEDLNRNAVLDVCECLSDLNGDLQVDALDLAQSWLGWHGLGPGDVDFNGIVNVRDMIKIQSEFGACPN